MASPLTAFAQGAGGLRGQVVDPSGAIVPSASLTLTTGKNVFTTKSGQDGVYSFHAVPPGLYSLTVDADGFARLTKTNISIAAGQTRELDVSVAIAVQQQNLDITARSNGVSVNPDENGGAIVLNGSDLDALSDDPDQLQNELQALAGPAAGPSGGEIYVDGFQGGQLPPKSSIREIRINQNPFSAEFNKIGYGRIEILTKPGSDKFSGHISSFGSTSALNTANPLVQEQPNYYLYSAQGDVNGPLTKSASYFFNGFYMLRQNQSIIVAVNPNDTTTRIQQALPNPSSFLYINPRVDLQLGKNNTLTIRESFSRSVQTDSGPGGLSLAEQAFNSMGLQNGLQIGDSIVVNSHLINETRFLWQRIRNSQAPNFLTPTVTVQGAFTAGGNNSGVVQDHQDVFELQNYSTATAGHHTMRFGVRLHAIRDANYSTSGSNGNYVFQSVQHYLAETPDQYRVTIVNNPLARAILFDAGVFFQDDWRWKPNLTLSYGLRFESQNWIRDHADWGPRLALAWAPGHTGNKPAKTVVRAGYGWFYDRFNVPGSLNSAGATPYVIQTIHQNGINQQSFVVNNPDFFNPAAPMAPAQGESTSRPIFYNIDRHFHAALNMQGGVGVDRQIGKATFNVTYLFTRGIHQFLSNNVTAPEFDPTTYTISGSLPNMYNYQFQSGGVYSQHQLITTANVRLRRISLSSSYTFSEANSDTQGANYFPSVAQNPGFDYGRASFGIHSRVFLLATYTAPHGVILAPLLAAQSGTPYNISIGSDLTGNNQFNARPTYGTCGAPGVVSTPFGCLDRNPTGKGETIVPFNIGTGPANVIFHMRASKVFGIGPKKEGASGMNSQGQNTSVSGRGLGGAQTGPKLDATVSRKYSLTVVAIALNLFNIVNRGPENGVLNSSLFGQSQTLAGGPYGSPTPGNRSILFAANFSF
ncbi:MAG TPA: carboxypeptidase regulatory-like domain-containing protein [Edaphobacter sp.]|nr:carboxypeptidase regulatory-like domain-containing protein [Edaphobacter sp.]